MPPPPNLVPDAATDRAPSLARRVLASSPHIVLTAFFVWLLFGGDTGELPAPLGIVVAGSGMFVVVHALVEIWRDRHDQ